MPLAKAFGSPRSMPNGPSMVKSGSFRSGTPEIDVSRLERQRYAKGGPPSASIRSTSNHHQDDFHIRSGTNGPEHLQASSRPRTSGSPTQRITMGGNGVTDQSPPPSHQFQRHFNQPIPRSSRVVYEEGSPIALGIGMAIGSPSQTLSPEWQQDPPQSDSFSTTFPTSNSPNPYSLYSQSPIEEIVKQKSRWKMFGGIFAKKNGNNPISPASPLQQGYGLESREQGLGSPQTARLAGPSRQARHRRASSRSLDSARPNIEAIGHTRNQLKKKPRKSSSRPEISRAQTEPASDFEDEMLSPPPPPKDYAVANSQASLVAKKPLLQVDIPDTSMERYSVMFGSVLRPTQSTLLARRQAQLEKLKMIDEQPGRIKHSEKIVEEAEESHAALPKPTYRRSTLPSPSSSPSYQLFPSPAQYAPRSDSRRPSYKASPLHRSATAPAAISPMRSTFLSTQKNEGLVALTSVSDSPTSTLASPQVTIWSSGLPSATSTEPSPIDTPLRKKKEESYPSIAIEMDQTVGSHNDLSRTDHIKNSVSHTPPIMQSPRGSSSPVPLSIYNSKTTSPTERRNYQSRGTAPTSAPRKLSLPQRVDRPPTAQRKMSLPVQTQTATAPPRKLSLPHQAKTAHQFRQNIGNNPLASSPPSAAEVSIARQISLSRRQQRLVVPNVSSVRQPMQATLVRVENGSDARLAADTASKGQLIRKSHHVVVETA